MAIYHLQVKHISAGAGQSAVAAAAYRHATAMESDKTGERFNYGSKSDVAHTEVILPEGAPAWARDFFNTSDADKSSERLWNHIEHAVTHRSGRYAQEFEAALPIELSPSQQIDLVRRFAKVFTDADRVVDFAIHQAKGNPHAHILITARKLTASGWSPAQINLLDKNGQLQYRGTGDKRRVLAEPVTGRVEHLREWRKLWEILVNDALENAGESARVDHRSFEARGIDLIPTIKRGPGTDRRVREGQESDRLSQIARVQVENARRLMERPAGILPLLREVGDAITTDQIDAVLATYMSHEDTRRSLLVDVLRLPEMRQVEPNKQRPRLYSVRDPEGQARINKIMARPEILIHEINDKRAVFTSKQIKAHLVKKGLDETERRACMASIRQSGSIEQLSEKSADPDTGANRPAAYTTPEFRKIEQELMREVGTLTFKCHHRVSKHSSRKAIDAGLNGEGIAFSQEQRDAIERLLHPSGLVVLEGFAGTGKSALFYAVNTALVQDGYRVRGTAVAAKAVQELKQSSGIEGQTLYSLVQEIKMGTADIGPKDIIVLDEAGMVGSRDMYVLVQAVQNAGAKLVLAGDRNQLQPISAGAPFRDIADSSQSVIRVEHIRRQKDHDHRRASQHFARGEVKQGLAVYRAEGSVHAAPSHAAAVESMGAAIASDIIAGIETLGLAHRNLDTKGINLATRKDLLKWGVLKPGLMVGPEGNRREVSIGERIVFLRNDKKMGVTNGALAKVTSRAPTAIEVIFKGPDGPQKVTFNPQTYSDFDYAYAVTIHKSQGVSVENTHVFAYPSMTRDLSYVAMTRHKKSVSLHFDETAFPNGLEAGLSRYERKTSTLDYADDLQDRAEFGQRHGLDTHGFFKSVAGAITRFIKSLAKQLVPAREIDYAPEGPVSTGQTVRPIKPVYTNLDFMTAERGKYLIEPSKEISPSAAAVAHRLVIEDYRKSPEMAELKTMLWKKHRFEERKAYYSQFWKGPIRPDAWRKTVAEICGKIADNYERLDIPNANPFKKRRRQASLDQLEHNIKTAGENANLFRASAHRAEKLYEDLARPKRKVGMEARRTLGIGVLNPGDEVLGALKKLCQPELGSPLKEDQLAREIANLPDGTYYAVHEFHKGLKEFKRATAYLEEASLEVSETPFANAIRSGSLDIDLAGKRLLEAGSILRQRRWASEERSGLSM